MVQQLYHLVIVQGDGGELFIAGTTVIQDLLKNRMGGRGHRQPSFLRDTYILPEVHLVSIVCRQGLTETDKTDKMVLKTR